MDSSYIGNYFYGFKAFRYYFFFIVNQFPFPYFLSHANLEMELGEKFAIEGWGR